MITACKPERKVVKLELCLISSQNGNYKCACKSLKRKTYISVLVIMMSWLLWPVSDSFLQLPYSTVVNDVDGGLLSAQIAEDHQWRFPVIEEVPERFEKSLLTFEDKRFYNHFGVDPLAFGRAVQQNLTQKRIVSGASTLTMQVARLVSNHKERSLLNKLKEIRLALRLELWYGKRDILRWYTSLAPFGGNVVGLEAACWRYFQKRPNQLSWAESATMAVLPNAPSLIHINKNRVRLLKKRNRLLQSLHDKSIIDDIDLEASLLEPLPDRFYNLPNDAPHLLQNLKSKMLTKAHVSINSTLQQSLGDLMNQLYDEWSENEVNNAGCLILDTKSGNLLAYQGNVPKTNHEQAVDMIQARRSSGSILKPFLYAHMVDEGLITPSELLKDVPTYIAGFNPSNYNRTYNGAVGADEALQRSLNVPAVRMLQSYGIDKFLHQLKGHNISTLPHDGDHYGLSLILGGGEVTLWELAHAYRQMGASLLDNDDKAGSKSILSKSATFQTLEVLKDLSRPDEEGNWQLMDSRATMAWKTGTSYGHRDAWAVGVSPDVTIAAWVGNADGEGRDGIVGTTTAGRLLFTAAGLMNLSGTWFNAPYEEMSHLRKCHHSGMLASVNCPQVETVLWPAISERSSVCKYHLPVSITTDGSYRIDGSCKGDLVYKNSSFLMLPPTVAQYYKRSHPEWLSPPPLHPACDVDEAERVMEIVYPLKDDVIYLARDFDQSEQSVVARVSHSRSDSKLFWYLDDQYLGESQDFHSFAFAPKEGHHKITIIDDHGNRAYRNIEILRPREP